MKPLEEMETLKEPYKLESKEYRDFIDGFDVEFKKEARTRYLEAEIETLQENVKRSQEVIRRSIPNNPSWFIDTLENLKDTMIVVKGENQHDNAVWHRGHRLLCDGIGGRMLYPYRWQLRPGFGMNLKQKIKKLKSLEFELTLLKEGGEVKRITFQMIEQAKKFPISNMIEFDRGFALCPFHKERTSSLKYYEDENVCHCFGACGESFDSIEVMRKLHNLSFKEAVLKLINKT